MSINDARTHPPGPVQNATDHHWGTKLAGDVVPFPKSDAYSGRGKETPVKRFDPQGDMTGGGKVVKLPGVD